MDQVSNLKTFELDGYSTGGGALTIFFAAISKSANDLSLQDWAAIAAIITGIVTTGYTLYKWIKKK